MTFQTPVTVSEVLDKVHSHDYLLPAIQREFVWRPDQIITLVDSLMRGYPIGSFLLWDVRPESADQYTYYNFITDYHELNAPFAAKATVPPGKGIIAVLDGQQRLTALNIALYGSYTERKKGAWASNASAYVKKRVYLNLVDDPAKEELGLAYDLRFLSDQDAAPSEGSPNKWFPLQDVLKLSDSGPAIIDALTERGVEPSAPFKRLHSLYTAIRETKPINWYLEGDQSADKVLEIFVRVNSGGTTLSYSDLLLSMATNQWETKDAREEVRSLVQDLNHGGGRDFVFTKDNVLKAALMISGLQLKFEVSTFTRENMAIVENNWDLTRESLVTAASLLKKLGYSVRNLSAHSIIVVLAYYCSRLTNRNSYVESGHTAHDRNAIKNWIARTLIKGGVWGSGLDTILARIRTVLAESETRLFPVEEIEKAMAQSGKSLTFDQVELEEVLESRYGTARTFALLSLLYPGIDLSSDFHQDHIYPKNHFSDKKLAAQGIPEDKWSSYKERYDSLPNLQLLNGQANVEKQDDLPLEWLRTIPEGQMQNYLVDNDLAGLDLNFDNFVEVFETRRARMLERLKVVLGLHGIGTTA